MARKKELFRADSGQLLKQHRTDEGYLRVDGYFTRAGVFKYYNSDGSIRKELRPPEEVFAKDSLATFAGKPLTDEHPKEFCDPDNVEDLQIGSATNSIEVADNGHVRIGGNVHKRDGIDSVETVKQIILVDIAQMLFLKPIAGRILGLGKQKSMMQSRETFEETTLPLSIILAGVKSVVFVLMGE